jgi:hypothetical protein
VDQVYLGVTTDYGGAFRLLTMRMQHRFPTTGTPLINNAHTFDGAVSTSVFPAALTVYGFEEYAGMSVYAMGNGGAPTLRPVSAGGGITFPTAVNVVHAGYPFYVSVETLQFLVDDSFGSVQGRPRSLSSVVALLKDSASIAINGFSAGIESDLVDGRFEVHIGNEDIYDSGIRVTTAQAKPLEVLALVARMQYGSY